MDQKPITLSSAEEASLAKLPLSAIVLFGSRARGNAGPLSDFDFGILPADNKVITNRELKQSLYDSLYDLLSKNIKQVVNLDLVFLPEAPMDIQASAVKYGVAIYESRDGVFDNYKAGIMDKYADFAPIRSLFQSAILARI